MFKAILNYDGDMQGNPRLSVATIVDDHRPAPNAGSTTAAGKDSYCESHDFATTLTATRDQPSRMILCPLFFTSSRTIKGGPGSEWPGSEKIVTCDSIGTRLSAAMWTTGVFVLHEYTHLNEIMETVWKKGWKTKLGPTKDLAYGFDACKTLDKKLATRNADSYANFANELFWTTTCDRDFDPPLADDFAAIDELIVLGGLLDTDPTEEDDPSAEGDPPAEAGSAARENSATRRDLAAKEGLSSTKGTQQQKSQKSQLEMRKRATFSQPYEHPIPMTDWENTYTVEQLDQYLEGHTEALHICSAIIEQAERNTARFNRIFRQYFKPDDREKVLGKFLSKK